MKLLTRIVAAGWLSFLMGCASTSVSPSEPVDRSKVPGPGEKQGWTPPVVETWRMENGLEVWFVEQRHTALAQVQLVLANGYATDPNGKEGLTELMTDLMNEGAGSRTALEVGKEFQRLGTDYTAVVNLDSVSHAIEVLPDNFGASMKLFADVVRRPSFSAEEFARRQEQLIAQDLASEARPSTGRSRAMRAALFGEGYAAYRGRGFGRTLKAIKNDDVKEHYKAVVAPVGGKLIVVGSLDKTEVAESIRDTFGDWSGKPTAQAAAVEERTISPALFLSLIHI